MSHYGYHFKNILIFKISLSWHSEGVVRTIIVVTEIDSLISSLKTISNIISAHVSLISAIVVSTPQIISWYQNHWTTPLGSESRSTIHSSVGHEDTRCAKK